MRDLCTIYRYELKKLTGRKIFRVMALLCLICMVLNAFSGLVGSRYVNGEPIESNYEAFRKDQTYRKAISGRYIDDALLKETVDGYARIPEDADPYTLTDEYETFARPYSDIYNLIRAWTKMDLRSVRNWEPDAAALYQARGERLESSWQSVLLTETEKEFWRGQESRIDKPLRYDYHEGYENILNGYLTVGVLMLLFTSICLSGLFADEHARRTDQLVLSSRKGRVSAYWAKIFAGITVAFAAALVMTLMTFGLNLGFYGAEGFGMPLQSSFTTYSFPITIGQACLIAYGVLIAASVLAAVFVMVISELFRSGIAVLSVSTGLIILGNVIMIPGQYRVIAQLWDWMPMTYLSLWNVFDARTLPLFGHCLVSWQVVPVIYILLSAALAVGGKTLYQRYQVSGR